MKALTLALALTIAATSAHAYSSTRCTTYGGTVRCTTFGDGGVSTTRCTTYGGVVRCSTW